jgi:hypothetical protein
MIAFRGGSVGSVDILIAYKPGIWFCSPPCRAEALNESATVQNFARLLTNWASAKMYLEN